MDFDSASCISWRTCGLNWFGARGPEEEEVEDRDDDDEDEEGKDEDEDKGEDVDTAWSVFEREGSRLVSFPCFQSDFVATGPEMHSTFFSDEKKGKGNERVWDFDRKK